MKMKTGLPLLGTMAPFAKYMPSAPEENEKRDRLLAGVADGIANLFGVAERDGLGADRLVAFALDRLDPVAAVMGEVFDPQGTDRYVVGLLPRALAADMLNDVQPNMAHTIRTLPGDPSTFWVVVVAEGGASLRVADRWTAGGAP